MTKITFIGAGSLGFTAGLVRDILTFPLLQDATISLMDINAERLDFAYQAVTKLVEAGGHPAKVEATLDRVEALQGADVVPVSYTHLTLPTMRLRCSSRGWAGE